MTEVTVPADLIARLNEAGIIAEDGTLHENPGYVVVTLSTDEARQFLQNRTDGADPELITGLAILLHQANLAALRGGLGAETQAARMALCRLLGIRETAMPLAGIESRIRAALAHDSTR